MLDNKSSTFYDHNFTFEYGWRLNFKLKVPINYAAFEFDILTCCSLLLIELHIVQYTISSLCIRSHIQVILHATLNYLTCFLLFF